MKLWTLLDQLTAAGLQPHCFEDQYGATVVVTPHGARVMGLFTHKLSDNAFWVNPQLATPESAQKFLAGQHVLGGDRLWIAPERGLFFKGNTEKDGGSTPPSIDPGNHVVGHHTPTSLRFVNEVNTTYHHVPGSTVRAAVERTIRMVRSPFADFPGILPELARTHFAGYEIASRFELLEAPNDTLHIGLWFLIQIACTQFGPAGHLYIPTLGRTVVTDYYEPTGDDYLRVADDHVRFKLDSVKRHKIGVRKTEITGRAGFLSGVDGSGHSLLVIRNFLNNPSANYADVPLHTPAGTQDSFQSYNHFSGAGGFGELEYHAPGTCRGADDPVVYDTNQVWAFTGQREDLMAIAAKLLGLAPAVFAV